MCVGEVNWDGGEKEGLLMEARDVVLLHGEHRGDEDLGMGMGRVGLTTPYPEIGRSRRRRRPVAGTRCPPLSAEVVELSEPIYLYDLLSPRKD